MPATDLECLGREAAEAMDRAFPTTAAAREAMLGAPSRTPVIPESEAWAIAMTWRHELQSQNAWHQRVRLKTNGDSFAVVESYEWVKIKVDTIAEAAVARAAAISWFWLSSCRGYSGRENPRFWKRVFAELQREQEKHDFFEFETAPTKYAAITDATRFFDQHEFPRIRLKVNDFDVCRVFYGLRKSDDPTVRRLSAIQDRLIPHMCLERQARPLPVRIEMKNLSAMSSMDDMLREASILSPSDPIARSPVESVLVHAWTSYLPDAQTLNLADDRLQLKTLEMTTKDSLLDHANLQPLFQADKSIDRPCARVHTLSLRRESMPMSLLASVCSALPYTETFSALQIMGPAPNTRYMSRNRGCRIKDLQVRPLDRMDWAWLGYALFHPDTKTSTWQTLDINVDSITPEAIEMLKCMARGNNLTFTENEEQESVSSTYETVCLRRNTSIHSLPALDADTLFVTESSVWMDEYPDPSEVHEDWIRIVAPGYGYGWVHVSDITEKCSRPAGTASLRGLRLHSTIPSQVHLAMEFVMLVGANLQQLDISNCGALESSDLHRVLFALPGLKSLTVKHDSMLWAVPLGTRSTLPTLEELSMTLEGNTLHTPHPDVLRTVLRHLKVLRIITHAQCFYQNRPATLKYVNELSNLTYFHWSDPEERAKAIYHGQVENTYQLGRLNTQTKLGGSVLARRSASCRLAFLSVLRSKRAENAVSAASRMGDDVSAHVFSFLSESCPMDLWVGA